MNSQKQAARPQPEKAIGHQPESAVLAERVGACAGLTELPGELLGASGDRSAEAQAARLGDARLQTAQRRALALRIGRVQGNQYLQRLIQTRAEPAHRVVHALPDPGAAVVFRVPRRDRPSATVPGLPARVVRAAQANLTSDPQAAINSITQALASRGSMDVSYLEGGGIAYVSDRARIPVGHYGHTSLAPGTAEPRPCRVIIGPDAMGSVSALYSTIMHEYQHVLQFRAGRTGEEAVTELEAFLWEAENLERTGMWRSLREMTQLPSQLRHWWEELSPEAQAPYRTRYEAAQANITRLNERRLREQFRQQTRRR